MTKDRESLLNEIVLNWRFGDVWIRKFNILKEFKQKYGDRLVHKGYTVWEFNLYGWLTYQIAAIKG